MNDVSETINTVVNNGTNGKSRITVKDPATKLAHKRLSVLQLAEALGCAAKQSHDEINFWPKAE